MESDLHSAKRHFEVLSDCGVLEIVDVPKPNQIAVDIGEFLKRGGQTIVFAALRRVVSWLGHVHLGRVNAQSLSQLALRHARR